MIDRLQELRERRRVHKRFRRHLPIIDESLREKTLNGQKTCLIRLIQCLDVNDTFEIFGAIFRITKLEYLHLEDACRQFYSEAGYDSYEQLRDIWISSHRDFNAERQAFIHWFKRIDDMQ